MSKDVKDIILTMVLVSLGVLFSFGMGLLVVVGGLWMVHFVHYLTP